MNGFMIAFVTVMVVTFNVAAGQNTTLSCSQEDAAEHNRLVDEINSSCGTDSCEEEQGQDDCRCCALYRSAMALENLCVGSTDDNKRVTVNVLSNINVNIRIRLDRVCIGIGSASTMVAGATLIAFTALAATMF